MSLSVPSLLAQNRIMPIGRTEAKTIEITSKMINLEMLKTPFSNDNIIQIIKNNGIHIIGGLVNVEIHLAIFNFSMKLFMLL